MRTRIIALLIVGLLLAPGLAAAQSTTPGTTTRGADPLSTPNTIATPAPCYGLFCGLIVQKKATRKFDASGFNLLGLQQIQAAVVVFNSSKDATTAMAMLLPNETALIHSRASMQSKVQETSVRALGDESLAISADIPKTDKSIGYEAVVVAERTESEIRVLIGLGALPSDPVKQLADVLESSLRRHVTDAAVSRTANGMTVGGVYDALPQLRDLPEGFVFTKGNVEDDDIL